MAPYISIIMPAYNAAKFIGRALDSILEQSYQNIEVILLNDGSKDETAKICVKYANRDSRIFFVDKENEGVAITRNCALKLVKGEYIMFVDADDVISPGSLQAIADKLQKTHVDLLRFEFKTVDENGQDLYPNYEAKRRSKYAGQVMDAPDFMNKVMRSEYQLCFNVFRKELLEKHSIMFLEGCTYNEDTLFLVHYFCISKTHVYIPHVVYGYRKFSGAVTNNFTEKNFKDVMNVFMNIMLSLPEDSRLHDSVKAVAERLGRRLYEANRRFKDDDVTYEVERLCCEKPITVDWKIYNILGSKPWRILDVMRQIIRKIRWYGNYDNKKSKG